MGLDSTSCDWPVIEQSSSRSHLTNQIHPGGQFGSVVKVFLVLLEAPSSQCGVGFSFQAGCLFSEMQP